MGQADFTGCTDLISQKKVQKTSAFAKSSARQAKKIIADYTTFLKNMLDRVMGKRIIATYQ